MAMWGGLSSCRRIQRILWLRLGGQPEVSLDGSFTAPNLSCDLVDGQARGAQPDGFDGSVRWLRRRGFELEDPSDDVPVERPESAIPSLTRVCVFCPQGQRKAGETGGATVAALERCLVGLSVVGVVDVWGGTDACRLGEVVVGGVVDQVTKLPLSTGEEIWVMHFPLQLLVGVPARLGSAIRVSWAGPGAPAWCLPGRSPMWR